MKSMIVEEGGKDLIAWKCATEDFEFGSQLVVHESQSAVFFRDGQALEVLGPGIHVLETENLPFLKLFTKLRFGRLFHCEVYFVNHSVQMNMPWGTDGRVRTYLEVEPGKVQPLSVGASGGMNLQADPDHAMKLLNYLLGTGTSLTTEGIRRQFNSMLNMMVKSHLGNVLQSKRWNVFDLDQHMEEISGKLKQKLAPEFQEYGLILREFHVSNFALPEEDPAFQQAKLLQTQRYAQHGQLDLQMELERKQRENEALLAEIDKKKALIQAETEAQTTAIKAQGEAARRSLEGITSVQEHQFDILERMTEAGGAGGQGGGGGSAPGSGIGGMSDLFGDVMKMSMGMQMMKEMGGVMKDAMSAGSSLGGNVSSAMAGQGGAASPQAPTGSPAGQLGTAFSQASTGSSAAQGGVTPSQAPSGNSAGQMGTAFSQASTGSSAAQGGVALSQAPNGSPTGQMGAVSPQASNGGPAVQGSPASPQASGEDWVCSNCGAGNPSYSRFCGQCGTPRPQPATEWICPNCQSKNPATSRFCGQCGSPKGGN